jgi:hypothetical protein
MKTALPSKTISRQDNTLNGKEIAAATPMATKSANPRRREDRSPFINFLRQHQFSAPASASIICPASSLPHNGIIPLSTLNHHFSTEFGIV